MKDRITLLLLPYLILLFALVLGYTFLHWLLVIELELFEVKEIITNFGFPIALAFVGAWFVLRPRFKILDLQAKKGDWFGLYFFISTLSLFVPVLIAQEYIVTATGKLTSLNTIHEIHDFQATKYYEIKQHYIDKNRIGVQTEFDVSGKYNNDFNMHIYVVLPIFGSIEDTIHPQPKAWLGHRFRKTISNRLEQEEKDREYKKFAEQSQRDFDQKNFSDFVYLEKLKHSDERSAYLEAIANNEYFEPSDIVFEAHHEPYEARNGNTLAWVFWSGLISIVVWAFMIAQPGLNQKQLKRIKQGKPDKGAQRETREFIEFLKPKTGFFFTPILTYLNVGIYLLMVILGYGFFNFEADDLIDWGANYGPLTKDGEWWRLLTSTMLHGGFMHIIANGVGLLFVGIFLEPILGKIRFLLVYLSAGILGSLASIWWYDATVSVGASGAVFGLYGIFLALMLTKVTPAGLGKTLLVSTSIFILFNLLMGLTGGIDNAAHIGGLVTGFLLGLLFYPSLKGKFDEEDTNDFN